MVRHPTPPSLDVPRPGSISRIDERHSLAARFRNRVGEHLVLVCRARRLTCRSELVLGIQNMTPVFTARIQTHGLSARDPRLREGSTGRYGLSNALFPNSVQVHSKNHALARITDRAMRRRPTIENRCCEQPKQWGSEGMRPMLGLQLPECRRPWE